MNRVLQEILLTLLLLSFLGLSLTTASDLEVHFIDVGQGDSILTIAPDGQKVLVRNGKHFRRLPSNAENLPTVTRNC